MKFVVEKGALAEVSSDIAVVGLFEDTKKLAGIAASVDKAVGGLISDFVLKKETFKGGFGDMYLLPTPKNKAFHRVLVVGFGKKDKFDLNKLRELSAKIAQKVKSIKNVKTATVTTENFDFDASSSSQVIAEGSSIAFYAFDKYKSKKDETSLETFKIVAGKDVDVKKAKEGSKKGTLYAAAVNQARDLANEPAMYATPKKLAEVAQGLKGIEVEVFDEKQIKKLKMNAFLAVAQGSDQPPRFIHMKYVPKNPKKRIAIIGKGLTFDSGGMDLKPPASMLNMKDDMSAAAGMIGIMKVIAELKPQVEIHALIASCENMVNGNSYKPGDVLIAKNGKTIEVDNTDAEGRITLADVLTYAEDLKVDEIVDMATLTGACMVALGYAAAGLMGNNQKLMDKLQVASKAAGENLWQLPMYEEYKDSLKSDIADMKNTGSRYGGASIAAIFLNNFIQKNTPWAHIDIAGPAFVEKANNLGAKNATGFGVRTILNYLLDSK